MVAEVGVEAARAVVVIVGGHEDGVRVALDPLAGFEPPLRAESARLRLEDAVHQALDSASSASSASSANSANSTNSASSANSTGSTDSAELPVCVVPMTLGRDPRLVADTARTLKSLAHGAAAGRVAMAEPFGNAALLTEWLRSAVSSARSQYGGTDLGGTELGMTDPGRTDLAILLTANAANRFDDAELFRIAHLVKLHEGAPWVEVAFRTSDPALAEGVERCRQLGARRVAVLPADFGPAADTPMPPPGVIVGGPLLSPSAVSAILAARVSDAMRKLSRGVDGIAAGLDADHRHGHGGGPWRQAYSTAG